MLFSIVIQKVSFAMLKAERETIAFFYARF